MNADAVLEALGKKYKTAKSEEDRFLKNLDTPTFWSKIYVEVQEMAPNTSKTVVVTNFSTPFSEKNQDSYKCMLALHRMKDEIVHSKNWITTDIEFKCQANESGYDLVALLNAKTYLFQQSETQ